MRKIDLIVVHCSATPPSSDIGAETIRRWHLNNNWSDIGYHYVIRRSGKLERGRPIEKAGAHAKGFNDNSIGICLVGGVNNAGESEDNYNKEQLRTLFNLLDVLTVTFPNSKVLGHNDLTTNKDCPCMNVKRFYYGC